MSVIPCRQNAELRERIERYTQTLKTQAHALGDHGLSADEFYRSGLFRGAIERIRGQFSAAMGEKRQFAAEVLDHMSGAGHIESWRSSGATNRFDYEVLLNSGRTAAIELKGCLDGNNTNIFERPPHAQEFVIWSVCTNPSADPRKNVWSGLHTRLSAEIISGTQTIDGIVVWDMVCGTVGRPCPKLTGAPERLFRVGSYSLPPPCLYLLPATVPSPRNNPSPRPQSLADVEVLNSLSSCFGCTAEEINHVWFEVSHIGNDTARTTRIERGGRTVRQSEPTLIRRG